MEQGIISSLGIGSGLDTAALVDQLVAAERQPREAQLNRSQQTLQAQLSAFGLLAAALDRIGTAADGIADLDEGRTVSVSRSALLSAQVEAGAQSGIFSVETLQLAAAQSLASTTFTDADTVVGTGVLSLTVAGTTVNIAIDAGNNSLAGIRDAINAANAGVSALVVDNGAGSQLLLTSTATGTANGIEIAVTDDDGNNTDATGLSTLAFNTAVQNLTETVAARDAQLQVNGLTVTRSGNQFDDVIAGVTLNLLAAEPGTQIQVEVQRDVTATRKAATDFVDALNNLGKQIDALSAFDAATGQRGALQGDSLARTLQSRLRDGLVTQLGANGALDQLVDIGITTGSDGAIEFDEATFNTALDTGFAGVTGLLAVAADHFKGLVDDFGEQSGLLGSRTDSIEARLEGIADRRLDLDRRMEQVEARLRNEFAALDLLISELVNTGNFLTSQLAALPLAGQQPR